MIPVWIALRGFSASTAAPLLDRYPDLRRSACCAGFDMAATSSATAMSPYGSVSESWRPNGGSGSTQKIAVLLNEICHLTSVTLSTFLVPNLSSKLFQSTNLKKVVGTMTFRQRMSMSGWQPAKGKRGKMKTNQLLTVVVLSPESGLLPAQKRSKRLPSVVGLRHCIITFHQSPEVYGEVIGAIDQEMISAATVAEMNRHGAGIAYILERLRAQGLQELLGSA